MLSQIQRRVAGLANMPADAAAAAAGIPVPELRRIRRRLGQDDELGVPRAQGDGDASASTRDESFGSIDRLMRERSSVCG